MRQRQRCSAGTECTARSLRSLALALLATAPHLDAAASPPPQFFKNCKTGAPRHEMQCRSLVRDRGLAKCCRQGHQSAVSPVLQFLKNCGGSWPTSAVQRRPIRDARRFATRLTRIGYGAAPRRGPIAAAAIFQNCKTGAPRPTGVPFYHFCHFCQK